jgi:hypothetical protein
LAFQTLDRLNRPWILIYHLFETIAWPTIRVSFGLSFHCSRHIMSVEARPVNKSIQEINDDLWVIGNRILLSRPAPGGVMAQTHFTSFPIPRTHYLFFDHCQPRLTSKWSMMLVGCRQSGASATPFAKSKSWIRVQHENTLRWTISATNAP